MHLIFFLVIIIIDPMLCTIILNNAYNILFWKTRMVTVVNVVVYPQQFDYRNKPFATAHGLNVIYINTTIHLYINSYKKTVSERLTLINVSFMYGCLSLRWSSDETRIFPHTVMNFWRACTTVYIILCVYNIILSMFIGRY